MLLRNELVLTILAGLLGSGSLASAADLSCPNPDGVVFAGTVGAKASKDCEKLNAGVKNRELVASADLSFVRLGSVNCPNETYLMVEINSGTPNVQVVAVRKQDVLLSK